MHNSLIFIFLFYVKEVIQKTDILRSGWPKGLTPTPAPLTINFSCFFWCVHRLTFSLTVKYPFFTTPLIQLAQCTWTFLTILRFHSVEKDVAIVKICVNSVLLVASLIGLYAAVMSTRLYHHHFQHICFNTLLATPMEMTDFDHHDHYHHILPVDNPKSKGKL